MRSRMGSKAATPLARSAVSSFRIPRMTLCSEGMTRMILGETFTVESAGLALRQGGVEGTCGGEFRALGLP